MQLHSIYQALGIRYGYRYSRISDGGVMLCEATKNGGSHTMQLSHHEVIVAMFDLA